MRIIDTAIADVKIIEPKIFGDQRGFFLESFNRQNFAAALGTDPDFVQDNHSRSQGKVLRGLHYQIQNSQAKLIRVVAGAIYDVAVDLRRSSPTFGLWIGVELSDINQRQLWIPVGFAHGFVVTSDSADVLYKATDYYAPEHERCLRWDDPHLQIEWPLQGKPLLSAKDEAGRQWCDAEVFP